MAETSLHFRLDPTRAEPLYAQIQMQIKYLLASGGLRTDDELPSVRAMAETYLINPNTVVRAYAELEREGLVYKKRGTGTFVSQAAADMAAAEKQRIVARRLQEAIHEGRALGLTDTQLRQVFSSQLHEPDSGGD
ncbi:MAG: GntR family transcriptional regulator [bacterium]|nr:GntR family transcriptional regulator [bacterium]